MFNELDFKEIDLTKEAPLEETKRQYYYIAGAWIHRTEKNRGRKKFYILSSDFWLSDE